jgi:hypothetical protein
MMSVLDFQDLYATTDLSREAAKNEDLSDDEPWLVAKAKSGHSEAFGELYTRHQRKAYHVAMRILRNAQDAGMQCKGHFSARW